MLKPPHTLIDPKYPAFGEMIRLQSTISLQLKELGNLNTEIVQHLQVIQSELQEINRRLKE